MVEHTWLWILKYMMRTLRASAGAEYRNLAAWRRFWRSWQQYRMLSPTNRRPSAKYLYPCIGDDTAETPIDPIYFYQDAWAFERIVERIPRAHIDVGSHHTFVALLSKVVPVTMVDIRPLSLPLESLRFHQGSLLRLPFADGSVSSLSSLCVVEHIGLGRYGDPLDPYGTEKAVAELIRILAPGGNLYLSLPLDDENRTYFNAHRAFSEAYVLDLFGSLEIIQQRYIYGTSFLEEKTPGSGFGTGCYHLTKR